MTNTIKYSIGIDIGRFDDTVAILCEIKDSKVYVLEEKSTSKQGNYKLTGEMKQEIIKLVMFHKSKDNCLPRQMVNQKTAEILGWKKYYDLDNDIYVAVDGWGVKL